MSNNTLKGHRSNFKQELFTQFARVGKAMSNGNRLELLEFPSGLGILLRVSEVLMTWQKYQAYR